MPWLRLNAMFDAAPVRSREQDLGPGQRWEHFDIWFSVPENDAFVPLILYCHAALDRVAHAYRRELVVGITFVPLLLLEKSKLVLKRLRAVMDHGLFSGALFIDIVRLHEASIIRMIRIQPCRRRKSLLQN